jgi:hypothetical protein
MSHDSKGIPDGRHSPNFPGLENAREVVASSSQAVLESVESLNDLWGRVTGRSARLADVLAAAATTWETYYNVAMDLMRLPFGARDSGRPGWAIFHVPYGQDSPATVDVPLSRSYDDSSTKLHQTEIQQLGGGEAISADYYHAQLVDKGRTLQVQMMNLKERRPEIGDYIGLVTVPTATAPLAVVMVTVRPPDAPVAAKKKRNR